METQTAFVRAYCVVVLNAVTCVGLHFALVVNPSYTERVNTIGNAETLYKVGFLKLGMFVVFILNGS